MAENAQAVVEGVVEPVEEQVIENKPKKTHTLLWLAIIVLLALLAGLAWFIYQQEVKHQTLISTLTSQTAANKNDALVNAIAQLKQTSSKQIETLTEANAALAGKMTEIAAMQQLTDNDIQQKWILSEVKFLLKAANQRILLAGDVENAQSVLTLADQQLQLLADPRLYQLRTLIADEQLALASVARVDIDGLAAQLQSAIDSVDSLTVLIGREVNADLSDNVEASNQNSENWQAALSDAWQSVRSMVVIRHQQDGASAVLLPEQRYFLYQNLQLKLQTARLALLSGRESVFQASLASAQQWLQQYFIGEERDALLQLVIQMQAETIAVTLPDISASLVWLQQKGQQQ